MLGPVKSRDLDRPVLASLETLVPQDHFYRRLEQVLDLSFVRDWVAACYAEAGRPSVDPIVFFKLQIVMLVEGHPEGTRSERKLIELASLNLAHRWATAARYPLERRALARLLHPDQDPTTPGAAHLPSLLRAHC